VIGIIFFKYTCQTIGYEEVSIDNFICEEHILYLNFVNTLGQALFYREANCKVSILDMRGIQRDALNIVFVVPCEVLDITRDNNGILNGDESGGRISPSKMQELAGVTNVVGADSNCY